MHACSCERECEAANTCTIVLSAVVSTKLKENKKKEREGGENKGYFAY